MLYVNSLHPISALLYFLSVLCFTMFINNPFMLLISFISSILFLIVIRYKFSKGEYIGFITMFLLVSITNPLFMHRGETVLFFLNNNPVTFEAFLYGVNLGILLLSTIFWFKIFNSVLTDDKILAIFDKISPKFAMIISMILRFVPILKRQVKKIKNAQITSGIYSSDTYIDKLKSNIRIYSCLITWSFENAISIGNSMKSRGYGNKKTTSFSFYKWNISDIIITIVTVIIDLILISSSIMGYLSFDFYPTFKIYSLNKFIFIPYVFFIILCFYPSIIEIKESVKWKYYIQKI